MAAGTIVMTEFINWSSGISGTTLSVPTRPRDIKAVDSLLSKLRIATSGAGSKTVFGHAFRRTFRQTGRAGDMFHRVEFTLPAPTEGGCNATPAFDPAVTDTVWFMGGHKPLVVFCASKGDAGDGRDFYKIADSTPVLMWTVDSVPRALRAVGRLWRCCEEGAGRGGEPAAGDAFDDLGSDYEVHVSAALSGIPPRECEAMMAGIRAAYCAAHGLPTASGGVSASGSGAGKTES